MDHLHLGSVDSTNAYLKRNYEGLDNFFIVSADSQTQGKGRDSRVWDSEEKKNLLFSLLIKDSLYFDQYKAISLISAYSIVESLKEYRINDLAIKWPNDVYVQDEKICGILLEAISKEKMECLIIGVGLNVNQKHFNQYQRSATSLTNILNKEIEIDKLKNLVFEKIISNIKKLNNHNFYQEIQEYDYLKNKEAYAEIHNEKKLVKIIGINPDYSLKVKIDDSEINLQSGEISFHL